MAKKPADNISRAANHVFGEYSTIQEADPVYNAFSNAITIFEAWRSTKNIARKDWEGFADKALELLAERVAQAETNTSAIDDAFDRFKDYYAPEITVLYEASKKDHHPQGKTGQQPRPPGRR